MQLDASLRGGEAPGDGAGTAVALLLPGGCLRTERVAVWDASPQALPAEDAEFDLRDVEPAAMFGRVVHFQLLPQPPRLRRGKGLVERGGDMSVEVVHHQHDARGVGVVDIDEVLDGM